jgi:hypothetical protein
MYYLRTETVDPGVLVPPRQRYAEGEVDESEFERRLAR